MRRYLAIAIEAATASFERLNPRERRLVSSFGVLLALSLVYVGVVEPIVDGRARLEKRLEVLSRDLSKMENLATKIQRLQSDLGTKTTTTNTSEDFSLFSFIDRATASSVASDAIASMNPTRRKLPEGLEENAVELRLQDIALSELVGLLRQIELAEEPVYIKRLDLRRRYDDRTRFDAIIIAGAISES